MTSRFRVFRPALYRNTLYLNHARSFHSFQPRLHSNSFLCKAYYQRSMNRSFANVNGDGLPGKPNPNYVLRILFVWSMIGGAVAYWNGWSPDIIEFAQQKFSYLEKFTRDKKSLLSSVSKLPKLKTVQEPAPKTPAKLPPKPQSKPAPKPKSPPKAVAKVVPQSAPKPPALKPAIARATKPKTAPKAVAKAASKAIAPVLVAIEELKEETKEASQELLDKYETLKRNVLQMTAREKEKEAEQRAKEKQRREAIVLKQTEAERNKAEIAKLRRVLDEKTLQVEELERDLNEKSEFLAENLKKLEDGRNAYDEMTQIFEEMRVEYQESIIQQMEHMENERRDRLNKLSKLTLDVRVLSKIMDWYNTNNHFFLSLAELNNIIHTFEHKIANGTAYASELQYLLNNLPDGFVSHKLLTDLKQANNENKTFHINSQQQLYDRFCVLEKALRETALTPKSTNSLWGNLFAKTFSFLLMKEQLSRSGKSLNDRISRAGYSMKLGDLDSALNELNYLDEDVLFPAQDWLKAARQRLLGLNAIKMLKSELLSRSVKMIDNELE